MRRRSEHPRATVLVVDDDEAIVELVTEALCDEGYAVTVLRYASIETIQEAVARHRPDCLLLDGGSSSGYEHSWETAALMSALSSPIPVIMFTAHTGDFAEAKAHVSERSQAAGFAALLSKPFELRHLFDAVASAIGTPDTSNME